MNNPFVHEFLYAFIAIFPMINPIAMSSVFFGMTEGATDAQRKKLAILVSLYGSALLLGALLVGPYVLRFFGLQTADIRIAGGLVVFSIAWKMLVNPGEYVRHENEVGEKNHSVMDQAFFPLTMPLTAGAGGIAMVVALATHAVKNPNVLNQYLAIIAAILAIFVLVYVCYRYSAAIFNTLGKTGGTVVSSLSAFILLAIGVSMIWSGVSILIMPLH